MKRNKQHTKKQNERQHATRRAALRFGIHWNRHKLRQFKKDIANSKWPTIEKQSNRITIFSAVIDEQKVAVVYDKQRKEVVTFMPLEWATSQ